MLQYKVYLFTFPNGKHYCGYTSQEPEKRWSNGNGYKHCPLVWRAIEKYGWNNVKKQIIASYAHKDYALSKEKQVIAEMQLTNPNYGYNIDQGGRPTGAKMTPEIKEKLSIIRKHIWAQPGYKQFMDERREAILHAKRKPLSPEHKEKISQSKKGTIPVNRKKIAQLNKDTEAILNTYESATAAVLALGKQETAISNVLAAAKGKRPTAYGYKWRIIE